MQIISNRSHGMPGESLFHRVHRMFPVEFGRHAQQHAPVQKSPEILGKHEKWTAPLFHGAQAKPVVGASGAGPEWLPEVSVSVIKSWRGAMAGKTIG